jgi:tetratricopeptide (TPR) repeat protein
VIKPFFQRLYGWLRRWPRRDRRSEISTPQALIPGRDEQDRLLFAVSRKAAIETLNRALQKEVPPATEDRDKSRFADHPDWVKSLADSAYLCECQGRYDEAEQFYQQVVALQRQRYGETHLEVAVALSDLAALYCLQARYGEAQPLLESALTIRQQHLPFYHLEMGNNLHQLANLYRDQKCYKTADPMFRQAIAIFRHRFGAQDARTQAVYNDLMKMIVAAIEGGQFTELSTDIPSLDLGLDSALDMGLLSEYDFQTEPLGENFDPDNCAQ